jgi:hypothetical protein
MLYEQGIAYYLHNHVYVAFLLLIWVFPSALEFLLQNDENAAASDMGCSFRSLALYH